MLAGDLSVLYTGLSTPRTWSNGRFGHPEGPRVGLILDLGTGSGRIRHPGLSVTVL